MWGICVHSDGEVRSCADGAICSSHEDINPLISNFSSKMLQLCNQSAILALQPTSVAINHENRSFRGLNICQSNSEPATRTRSMFSRGTFVPISCVKLIMRGRRGVYPSLLEAIV